MPNYNKSFNFRSGVQVDYDNFIVNSNGLVGIGTSVVSTYLFNVYGDTRVTGLTTTKNLQVSEVATVGFLTASQGIHVSSAVTATAFYGDGSTLSNIVGFSTNAWILNIAQTGLSTSLNIGIGTQALDAYDLVIGDDPLVSEGISFVGSTGNVYSSGIVTATSFSGSGAGLTALSAPQLTGTINNARLPANINVSGIITASLGFNGNLTGIASTAHSITNSADIRVNSINSGFSTTGISTVFTKLEVGTGGTAFSALNSGKIGIGTALPTSELQIIKESDSLLEVISNTGQSRISIGQSVGVGNSSAVLRFGDPNKTFDIINRDTGNINYYLHAGDPGIGTGRFSWIYGQGNLERMSLTYGGKLGLGKTNPDQTLHVVGTSTVTGDAYFGSNVTISGNLTLVNSSIPLPPVFPGNVYATSGLSTFFNVGISTLKVTNRLGINTDIPKPYLALDVTNGGATFGTVGVGTTANQSTLRVVGASVFTSIAIGNTSNDDASGLSVYGGTTTLSSNTVSGINSSVVIFDSTCSVGVGTTSYRAAVDLGDAGKNAHGGVGAFMIVPRLTSSQRAGLVTSAGAVIFNLDELKFQGYTGVAWINFH